MNYTSVFKKTLCIFLKFAFISLLFILPDIIFHFIDTSFKVSRDVWSFGLICILSLCFALSPNKFVALLFITLLTVLQIIQFAHIACFATQLSPFSIYLLSKETLEVFEDACLMAASYWYILPIVIIPYFLIFYITDKWQVFKNRIVGSISVIMFFIATILVIFFTKVPQFEPNEARFTLFNSVNASLSSLVITLKKYKIKNYLPYQCTQVNQINEPVTIVYIVGESCNSNHMSLFGYKVDTTPNLRKLAEDPSFYYTRGISGAIATLPSLKFMLNVIGEPDNMKAALSNCTNLFMLAKQAGFKTFFISAQRSNVLHSISGIVYIDHLVNYENYIFKFKKYRDEFLLTLLNQLKEDGEFGDKNFVVIQERCVHRPYENNIGSECSIVLDDRFKNDNEIIENYDKAMFYNDFVTAKLFNFFNKSKDKFYIFFASDHGEMLGETGLWGHGAGRLTPEVAQIPIMLQTNDKEFLKKFKTVYPISHYTLAKIISRMLGFEVINPNEQPNIGYINGVDHCGGCGFIKFQTNNKNEIEYTTVFPEIK